MINTRSSVSLSNQEEPRQHELARHHVMNVVDGMNQVSIHLLMTSVSEAPILNNHVTFSIAICSYEYGQSTNTIVRCEQLVAPWWGCYTKNE